MPTLQNGSGHRRRRRLCSVRRFDGRTAKRKMAYETASVVVKDSPRRALSCLYEDCGYQWMSRIEPEKCPHCKRRGWQKGESTNGRPRTTPRPPIEKVQPRLAVKSMREPIVKKKITPEASRSPARTAIPRVEVKREKLQQNMGRPTGKCPHDYMNWLLCPTCNPR